MAWHTSGMETANIVLRLMAASQVLLFISVIVFSKNPARVRIVGCVLMLGIFSYLVGPLYYNYIDAKFPFILWLASLVPSWILLFVWVVFEENEPMPVWVLGIVLVTMLLVLFSYLAQMNIVANYHVDLILQYSKIICVGLALYVVWRGRDADLVEMRLKFRTIFIASILFIALSIIFIELLSGFVVPLQIEVIGMALILVCGLIFNFFFMRINPSAKLVGEPQKTRDDSDDEMIQALLKRMRDERLYADHDLRVASLADTLNVPEYQLRKRINQQLGYRNFNQFVNRYRIEEAATRLIENNKTPVLNIALDVGFRSISSFNTTFLSHFGVSPTQYRTQANTGS